MTERSFNLVVPLVQGDLLAPEATAMRITDTADHMDRAASGAVSRLDVQLPLFRPGDVDSTNRRSTPATTLMPGARTSLTATRTTTTRTTSSASCSSADQTAQGPQPGPADFSFHDLVQAYEDCSSAKRNKASRLEFDIDRERNLIRLDAELRDGTYRPGPSTCFVITRPRPREVWAAGFRDRIVHHLFYNRVAARFHAGFIADSSACIPGRGTLYGVTRLEARIRSITQNWSRPAWYLKLDLANFFVTIDKRIVAERLAARISEPWWLQLGELVLFHDPRQGARVQSPPELLARIPPHKSLFSQPPHLGLPIGNLSSQFFANVHLDPLDQHIKQAIGARHYSRYVDDMVLLHEDPRWLNAARADIEAWLPAHLGVRLNPAKTILQPVDRGVDFVGQVIRPWRRTLRRRTFNDALARVAAMPAEALFETANSYFGLLRRATHSHGDRARLANLLRWRGHTIAGDLTQTFRTKPAKEKSA